MIIWCYKVRLTKEEILLCFFLKKNTFIELEIRKIKLKKKSRTALDQNKHENLQCKLLSIPAQGKYFCTVLCRKLSTVKKVIFFECRWQFEISLGERCECIFVSQSIRQSMTHCYKLQAPGLWKSRQSPMKLNQIMSTDLQAAHKQEVHRCHPIMNSSGH